VGVGEKAVGGGEVWEGRGEGGGTYQRRPPERGEEARKAPNMVLVWVVVW